MILSCMTAELHVLGRCMTDSSRGKMSGMLIQRMLHLLKDGVKTRQLSFSPEVGQRRKDMRRRSVAGKLRSSIMMHVGCWMVSVRIPTHDKG